jgi:hypothetical protein
MRPARLRPVIVLAALPLLAALALQGEPVRLAGDVPAGELDFAVLDPAGQPIPARLTFRPLAQAPDPTGTPPELFGSVRAAPAELAVRSDVVTTRSGRGRITVPVGRYEVFASRGLEWSLASAEVAIAADAPARLELVLRREIDTTGWISGDFHLHTLTHSGHGDADLNERVLTFLGEGLEFAVATDHDHRTDYGPTVAALGVESQVATVTGNEVSTPIGHFNAFPLDPAKPPVDSNVTAAGPLFALLRAQRDARGRAPVLQVNHPRWEGIDYFTRTGLDPLTGRGTDPSWSSDFDTIEVLNENVGWGLLEPGETTIDTRSNAHSVLRDWFHLLQRGARPAAVGNSDSHTVRTVLPGLPRNFVRSATDDPAAIDPGAVAEALREHAVFTTLGPFVELSVEGTPMGGTARARNGRATLAIRVQAASWVDCDRVKVLLDGDVVAVLEVPDSRSAVRLERQLELEVPSDAFLVVLVEGDDPLPAPVYRGPRPILPWALSNPVWIDADGDGAWTPPAERVAAALAAQPTPAVAREWFPTLRPEERALALAEVPRGPFAGVLISLGLADAERRVRLAAARAGERCAVRGTSIAFEQAFRDAGEDAWFAALARRAIIAARPELAAPSLEAFLERFGVEAARRHRGELDLEEVGLALADWTVWTAAAPDPRPARASSRGYLDLAAIHGTTEGGQVATAETWIHVDTPRRVRIAMGTDDGSRAWLGELLLYDDPRPRGANPLERIETVDLAAGWNRLRVEVKNEGGPSGLYARVLAGGVTHAASEPR